MKPFRIKAKYTNRKYHVTLEFPLNGVAYTCTGPSILRALCDTVKLAKEGGEL